MKLDWEMMQEHWVHWKFGKNCCFNNLKCKLIQGYIKNELALQFIPKNKKGGMTQWIFFTLKKKINLG